MTQLLMLDAAFPPDPGGLITDITTVGAQGAFLYVWGPFVNGSPGHVLALRNAGLEVVPIIVPGNIAPDPTNFHSTLQAWHFDEGPVFFDFERGSDPGKAWFDNATAVLAAEGYRAEPYGTLSVLGQYDPEDKDWVANWLRTGILEPIPQLPPDWEAWQFVNDIMINGHQYDASVVSTQILGGIDEMTDAEVVAHFIDLYENYAGRYPTATDFDYIRTHWLPEWHSNPVQARSDFGIAAATEVNNQDVRPMRVFEVEAAIKQIPKGDPGPPGQAIIHDHPIGPNAVLSGRTELNHPPTA